MSAKPEEKSEEPGGFAWLLINKHIIPLNRLITTIGRKRENDVVIHDLSVSRNHAQIRYENGKFTLYDLSSTGGTFVNKQKVDRADLENGDVIILSIVPFIFIEYSDRMVEEEERATSDLVPAEILEKV